MESVDSTLKSFESNTADDGAVCEARAKFAILSTTRIGTTFLGDL